METLINKYLKDEPELLKNYFVWHNKWVTPNKSQTTTSGSFFTKPEIESPTADVEEIVDRKIDERYDLLLDFFFLEFENMKRKNEKLSNQYIKQAKELFAIRKELNINKIDRIALLKKGWAGEGSEEINKKIISIVRKLILSSELKVQPELFPTRNGTIQFEYQNSKNHFIEIEIFEDNFELYGEINGQEIEKTTDDFNKIVEFIEAFRSR